MSDNAPAARLLAIVEADLVRVDQHVAKYRRQNGLLIIGGIVASTLATLLAGGMAAGGPPVADLAGGWRVGCTVVALAAAIGALSTGLAERLRISEHLANATACGARLGALRFSLRSSAPDLARCEEQYREILETGRIYMT